MADLPEQYTVRLVDEYGENVSEPFLVSTVEKIMKIEAKKSDTSSADIMVNWDT